MIAQSPDRQAEGVVLQNPTAEDLARLDYYEGGFAYDLREVQVTLTGDQTIPAQVYFPQDGLFDRGDLWSLEEWKRDWGESSLIAAREAMDHFGRWSAEDLVQKLPLIRRRADTLRAARQRGTSPDHRDGAQDVEILSRDRVHSHFFALERMVLRHPRYDGSMSPPLDREAFYAGRAVVVLPYDPVRDEVLLIEQFRVNMFALGDPSSWVVEAVAGLIDPGEDPETAARRELDEEAGVTATDFELVSETYSSTGSSTEFIHAYIGLADFSTLGQGGGLEAEGEDIRRIVMSFDEFAEGLRTHRFRDAPLVSTGYWLMLNRERLRSSA